jgi:hypothetical protein
VQRYRTWSLSGKALFWVLFFSCCGLAAYAYLIVLGVPTWVPRFMDRALVQLPGVN